MYVSCVKAHIAASPTHATGHASPQRHHERPGVGRYHRPDAALGGRAAIGSGLLTIWCRHTSASLQVQENADPDVRADIVQFFRRIAPEKAVYRHSAEGPDDMPAHIKAALTQTQLSIPVEHGRPALGTWLGTYLFEHRSSSHKREIILHLLGE
jgi:secondary thiamine-phosphate synthase enzyme